MTLQEIRRKVEGSEYDFLSKEPLGDNVILLGLGGSYAYGTNIESSDIDIRGIATHSAKDILIGGGFEQVEDKNTDTVIYSLKKILSLLSNCNPNTIEILGLRPEHYLYISSIGQDLLNKKEMFLSKRAVSSFGGYASQQLHRLKRACYGHEEQSEQERHLLETLKNVMDLDISGQFCPFGDDGIKLYIDEAVNEGFETEIFMDVYLEHYPLRDYLGLWAILKNIEKDYGKIGKRNKTAIEHEKLGKHMMHLVRLYLMAFDLLENGEINTYREKDHDFLMDIRNGKYLTDDFLPVPEFFDMVEELDDKLLYWKEHSPLPSRPDYDRINQFLYDVNESIVREERC